MISASRGIPESPSQLANRPSFITPPEARSLSCVSQATTASNCRAYVIARRITWALRTVARPFVNATAPASCSRPISLISSPRSPFVRAAAGWTLTSASSRAVFRTNSTSATSSITGSVSGIMTSVVTPPAAAAALAEAMVSRCSPPGSPMKTRASTSPGTARRPVQSVRTASSGAPWFRASRPAARMVPSATTMVPISSRSREGSTMRTFSRKRGRAAAVMTGRLHPRRQAASP